MEQQISQPEPEGARLTHALSFDFCSLWAENYQLQMIRVVYYHSLCLLQHLPAF